MPQKQPLRATEQLPNHVARAHHPPEKLNAGMSSPRPLRNIALDKSQKRMRNNPQNLVVLRMGEAKAVEAANTAVGVGVVEVGAEETGEVEVEVAAEEREKATPQGPLGLPTKHNCSSDFLPAGSYLQTGFRCAI